jgi:hypothetical protein
MAHSIRNVQSTSSRSLLLDLYKQREQATNTAKLISIQTSIDQIIAQNYLNYVNR